MLMRLPAIIFCGSILLDGSLCAQEKGGKPRNRPQPTEAQGSMLVNEEGEMRRKRRGGHKRLLEKLDKDGDGRLSESERAEARKAAKYGKRGAERRRQLLERFDADGDGSLSKEERKKARSSMERRRKMSEVYLRKLKKKFTEQFDADGDGEWSAEESRAAKEHFSTQMQQVRVKLVQAHDADGDGKLSTEERKAAREVEKRVQLERFDADGDGQLNEAERRQAFDAMLEEEPYRLMHMMLGKKRGEKAKGRGGAKQRSQENAP